MTLQPGEIVVHEDDTPATKVCGGFSKGLLLRIVEKPEHTILWQQLVRVIWVYITEMDLRDEGLWQAIAFWPAHFGRQIGHPAKLGHASAQSGLLHRVGLQADRCARDQVNVLQQARESCCNECCLNTCFLHSTLPSLCDMCEQIIFSWHVWTHAGSGQLIVFIAAPLALYLLRHLGYGVIRVHLRAVHRPRASFS